MLEVIGVGSVAELIDETVPASIRVSEPMALPAALERARGAWRRSATIAAENRTMTSLIGMGYSGTHTPPVIKRNVLENPAWYTAYTPYQPEISQGRLEALLNFQTMVSDLTGLDIANASLLDEATAAAEAMTMARRLSKAERRSRSSSIATPIRRRWPCSPPAPSRSASNSSSATSTQLADGPCFGALFSYPTSTGAVVDWTDADRDGARRRCASWSSPPTCWPACCCAPPGELGADIAVGSAQRFGVPMGFGGPHAGFIAVRDGGDAGAARAASSA